MKPSGKHIAVQVVAGVFCLVVGFGALAYAIANPQLPDRAVPIVAGSIIGLLGLVLCLMFTRVLHTRTYTFTEAAFEGEDYSYRTFQLPWSEVSEITMQAFKKGGILRALWRSAFVRRAFRNPSTAFLYLRLRDGAEVGEGLSALTNRSTVTVPFWNQPEQIDALAYGCRTFAPDRFRGVRWL